MHLLSIFGCLLLSDVCRDLSVLPLQLSLLHGAHTDGPGIGDGANEPQQFAVLLHPLMQVADGVLGNRFWAQQGRHQGLEYLHRYRQHQIAPAHAGGGWGAWKPCLGCTGATSEA